MVAYGQIIPKEYLGLTKGFINIHGSLCLNGEELHPSIQRSIMNLDDETGISIMRIVEELDSGPICNFYKIKINDNNSQ